MTNPGKMHDLYQVYVTDRATGEMYPHPHFPRADKKAVDMFADTIANQIRLGNVKQYTDPRAVLYLGPTENQMILEK